MKLVVSKRARAQIERAQAWWVAHRDERGVFLDELAEVEGTLRADPLIGVVYASHPSGDIRRILLLRTKVHIYYRFRVERDELTVLAVWGATRERGPKLG